MSDSPADTKGLVREYLAAFNDRDRDAMAELLTPDAVEHGVHEELEGREAIVDFLAGHFEAFPDYSGTTEAMVAEGDLVTVRYTASGTHTGEYRDVEPTGHRAEWTGIAIYRIEEGEIAEIWLEEDRLGLLEQLELIDEPAAAHLRL
jgi:predicted ester cyclase